MNSRFLRCTDCYLLWVILCSGIILPCDAGAQVTKTLSFEGFGSGTLTDETELNFSGLTFDVALEANYEITVNLDHNVTLTGSTLALGPASGSHFMLVNHYLNVDLRLHFRDTFSAWMTANGIGFFVNQLPGNVTIPVFNDTLFPNGQIVNFDAYEIGETIDNVSMENIIGFNASTSLKNSILSFFPAELRGLVDNFMTVTATVSLDSPYISHSTASMLDGPGTTDFAAGATEQEIVIPQGNYEPSFNLTGTTTAIAGLEGTVNFSIALGGNSPVTLGPGEQSIDLNDEEAQVLMDFEPASVRYLRGRIEFVLGSSVGCGGRTYIEGSFPDGYHNSWNYICRNLGETDVYFDTDPPLLLDAENPEYFTLEQPTLPPGGILHPEDEVAGFLAIDVPVREYVTFDYLRWKDSTAASNCEHTFLFTMRSSDIEFTAAGTPLLDGDSRSLVSLPDQTTLLQVDMENVGSLATPLETPNPVKIISDRPGLWSVVQPTDLELATGETDSFQVIFTPNIDTTASTAEILVKSDDIDGDLYFTVVGSRFGYDTSLMCPTPCGANCDPSPVASGAYDAFDAYINFLDKGGVPTFYDRDGDGIEDYAAFLLLDTLLGDPTATAFCCVRGAWESNFATLNLLIGPASKSQKADLSDDQIHTLATAYLTLGTPAAVNEAVAVLALVGVTLDSSTVDFSARPYLAADEGDADLDAICNAVEYQATVVIPPDFPDYVAAALDDQVRDTAGTFTCLCSEDPEGEGEMCSVGPVHSADQNASNSIDLTELLRVIQFFNTAGFGCEFGTEDGFAPNDIDQSCCPHDSDYNDGQSWTIELTELLRLVQVYNSGAYNYCPDELTEDAFCPLQS